MGDALRPLEIVAVGDRFAVYKAGARRFYIADVRELSAAEEGAQIEVEQRSCLRAAVRRMWELEAGGE